jgi:hypothetical protein
VVKRPAKSKRTFGLKPSDFPRNVRHHVDQDYVDTLSPEDKAYLAEFNEHFYGASFTVDTQDWSPDDRRISYRRKNAINADLYSIANSVGHVHHPENLDDLGEDKPQDWNPQPLYQNTPEYTHALAELRAAIDVRPPNPVLIATVRRRLEKFIVWPSQSPK